MIVALIPLAPRGIPYRPLDAAAILRRNMLIYGLGEILLAFIGFKLINVTIIALRLVDEAIPPPRAP